MKWYSTKKFQPSYDGHYIIRYLDDDGFVGTAICLWNAKNWVDYDENNHRFKGHITHFAIPDPVEIEE